MAAAAASSDCFVSFRREEDIAAIVAKARTSTNIGNVDKVDVCKESQWN